MRLLKSLKKSMVVIVLVPGLVVADGGYFTTYSHHINKGEVELMFMTDFTRPSKANREEGQRDYYSQMPELEWHATNQLAMEFMVEAFQQPQGGVSKFTGARYEARYRLFANPVPLNPTLYAEYEDLHHKTRYKMEVSGWIEPPYEEEGEEEPRREKILESRAILSQDSGPWNFAFDWINESDLRTGVADFGYAMGAMYRLGAAGGHAQHHGHGPSRGSLRPATMALELVGGVGDSKKFDVAPSRQQHYLQPSVMFHMGHGGMLGFAYAKGLTAGSDNLFRLMTGWEF